MGKYQIIYADPPWSYRSGKVQLRKRLTGPEELGGILKQYFGLENISYLPPR